MPSMPMPICNGVLMGYLKCTYVMPVNFYQKFIMSDMFQIPAEILNHYTMVYSLNSDKLKDRVVGYRSAYWKTMEDCFSDTKTFDAGHERVKGYSRPGFDALQALDSHEVKFHERTRTVLQM